jgi:hypothetical protein
MVRNREDLAWAAGIICGEGGFYVGFDTKQNLHKIFMYVSQSSKTGLCPEMLTRLLAIIGIGRVKPRKSSGLKVQAQLPQWIFLATRFRDVQAIGAMTWAWLTPEKKDQLIHALTIYRLERA